MNLASASWLMGLSGGAATLLGLIVYVIFLVVAFGVVRRHRPDAWGLVAGWAGASIALSIMGTVLRTILPMVVNGVGSPESFYMATAATTVTLSLLHAAVDVLLVLAIVRLARGAEAPRS
jgi:hypothetical protein